MLRPLASALATRTRPKPQAGSIALCHGHIASRKSRSALERLAEALEVPEHVVEQALAATKTMIAEQDRQAQEAERLAHEAAEAAWRKNFRPHAVIETESKCPSSIVMCGMTGGVGRWLIVPVDSSKSPMTFVRQVLDVLPTKLHTGTQGQSFIPFFGQATGLHPQLPARQSDPLHPQWRDCRGPSESLSTRRNRNGHWGP